MKGYTDPPRRPLEPLLCLAVDAPADPAFYTPLGELLERAVLLELARWAAAR